MEKSNYRIMANAVGFFAICYILVSCSCEENDNGKSNVHIFSIRKQSHDIREQYSREYKFDGVFYGIGNKAIKSIYTIELNSNDKVEIRMSGIDETGFFGERFDLQFRKTGLVHRWLESCIKLEYMIDNNRLMSYVFTWKNYYGGNEIDDIEENAEYYLDDYFIGKGEEGLRELVNTVKKKSIVQAIIPWKSYPNVGEPRSLPFEWRKLAKILREKGVKMFVFYDIPRVLESIEEENKKRDN